MATKASLSILFHGEPGSGKSWAGATAPEPRLLLDAEGGSRFCPLNHPMVTWDPTSGPPPEYDGTWKSCFVSVRDWRTFDAAHQWLASGQHPFKSVVLDSFTELQKRLVDTVAGITQPTQQQWGEVLRRMEDKARAFRDLAVDPANPLEAVVAICLSHRRDEQVRPFVKGSLELSLPGFFDVVAYMYTATDEGTGEIAHQSLLVPINSIIAKDRTNMLITKYGPAAPYVNVTEWLDLIRPLFA
jgi:hypothetical protein